MALGRDFFKNTFKIAGSTAIAQGIGILTIPIFARLFTPEVVGQYAIFTSLVGILAVFGSGRYELALMLPQEKERAMNILKGAIGIAFVWTILLLIVVFFCRDIIQIKSFATIRPYLMLVPVAVFFTCFNRILLYWFNREKRFGTNALLNIFNSGGTKIANVGIGFIGWISVSTLIFVNLVMLAGECILRLITCRKTEVKWNKFFYKETRKELIRYKKFPLIDSWNGLLDTASLLIVPILLSCYFSATDVGLYSQSLTLVQLPVVLIASALGQVFFQRLSEARYTEEMGQVVADTFAILLQVGIPIFLIVFLWGKEIFSFFLGERWAMSGTYAEILAPWCCLKLCFSPLSSVFTVLERQGLALFLTITIILTRVMSIVIGGIYNNIYLAILLFGISGVFVNLLGLLIIMLLSKQKYSNLLTAFCKSPLAIFRK